MILWDALTLEVVMSHKIHIGNGFTCSDASDMHLDLLLFLLLTSFPS